MVVGLLIGDFGVTEVDIVGWTVPTRATVVLTDCPDTQASRRQNGGSCELLRGSGPLNECAPVKGDSPERQGYDNGIQWRLFGSTKRKGKDISKGMRITL